jgi:type VI secretion system FHA domain protein
LGEYELLVSIDKSNDFPPDESAIVAYDGKAPSSSVRKSTANDLGADLDLSQLLEPSDQLAVDSGVHPRNAYGQAIGPDRDAPIVPTVDDKSGTPWHMMTRPLRVEGKAAGVPGGPTGVSMGEPSNAAAPSNIAAPIGGPPAGQTPRAPTPVLFEGDFDVGLSAFCRGAGVDPRSITPEARGAALQLAGQLLRESVLGLMDLNQSRNEFRNRFRIPPPPNDGPESPLNFSRGVDEAMVRLLSTGSARASSVNAVRDNFKELKAQNTASLAAMRAAFEEFLGRVDPKDLEERFDRATKRGVFGAQNKGKYWELYAEMFAGLAMRPADGFPHLFTEAFAKAYEAKLRTLIPPRRSAFGADRNDLIEPDDKAVGDP